MEKLCKFNMENLTWKNLNGKFNAKFYTNLMKNLMENLNGNFKCKILNGKF